MRARLKKILRIIIITVLVIMIVYYFYPEEKFPPGVTIDKIEIYKSESRMLVYSKSQLIKTYKVSIGGNPAGQKEFEGDRKTPEGIYFITAKNSHSDFYKNLGVSYPSGDDIQRAQKLDKQAGGDIKIHGIKNGLGFIGKFQRWINWTAGCIALTDQEMDEIYEHTPVGTKIEIKP